MPEEFIVIEGWGSVSSIAGNSIPFEEKYLSARPAFDLFKGAAVAMLNRADEEAIAELGLTNKKYKDLDRSVLMAIVSAKKAMKMAGWTGGSELAVNIGSSRGATSSFEKYHDFFQAHGKVPANTSPLTTLGNISSWVGQDLQASGGNISHSVTCSTGLQAIANAFAWLKSGMATKILAGGAEAPITPFTLAQMKALGIYSDFHPSSYPCRPFNSHLKNTFTLGEGAAVFAMAKVNRQDIKKLPEPPIIVESVGFGFEEISSKTGISPKGLHFHRAITDALRRAKSDEPIDLIVAHAPGTVAGDRSEWQGINTAFCDGDLPLITSAKWLTGHTLGASGALSIEYAINILKTQRWLEFPYETTIKNLKRGGVKRILITAAGFGGNAAAVVLKV